MVYVIKVYNLQLGDEVQRVTREAAVWAVAFSNSTLLVTDWNDTLSFYNLQGQQTFKERNIGKKIDDSHGNSLVYFL